MNQNVQQIYDTCCFPLILYLGLLSLSEELNEEEEKEEGWYPLLHLCQFVTNQVN